MNEGSSVTQAAIYLIKFLQIPDKNSNLNLTLLHPEKLKILSKILQETSTSALRMDQNINHNPNPPLRVKKTQHISPSRVDTMNQPTESNITRGPGNIWKMNLNHQHVTQRNNPKQILPEHPPEKNPIIYQEDTPLPPR